MKVLHANTYERRGGAAIAARRLHLGLLAAGEDSRLAVVDASGETPHVSLVGRAFSRRFLRPVVQRMEHALASVCQKRPKLPSYTTFSLLPSLSAMYLNKIPKDILHLHWVGEGFLSPWDIAGLQGPVVWTMHDTWPFTGGCHYPSENCCRYVDSCGQCPELCSQRIMDISHVHWKIKRRAVKNIRPTVIALSKAFARMAKQSGMLRGCRVEHIPNCIDSNVFTPVSRESAREALGLPQRERIVLFGALAATSDHRKGFDLLQDALRQAAHKIQGKFLAVVFGAAQAENASPCEARFLGHLHDEVSLKLAYSAADIFVCPSREDNLPNTIMESLACGTPVAGFAVGGIPDMVEHGVNGYLAAPQDTEDLAAGIAALLGDAELRRRMGHAGREKVEKEFSFPVIARKHIILYEDILTQQMKHARRN